MLTCMLCERRQLDGINMMESSVDSEKKEIEKEKQLLTTTWNVGCNYVQVDASEARLWIFLMKKDRKLHGIVVQM